MPTRKRTNWLHVFRKTDDSEKIAAESMSAVEQVRLEFNINDFSEVADLKLSPSEIPKLLHMIANSLDKFSPAMATTSQQTPSQSRPPHLHRYPGRRIHDRALQAHSTTRALRLSLEAPLRVSRSPGVVQNDLAGRGPRRLGGRFRTDWPQYSTADR
jgi:hypothetical protein